jgi:hypothetical protein
MNINAVLGILSDELDIIHPEYVYSPELRYEGIRGEYTYDGVIHTTEPDNLLLAIHEFVHYVHDELYEMPEKNIHGKEYRKITKQISILLKHIYNIRYTIKDIVNVPIGEEIINEIS